MKTRSARFVAVTASTALALAACGGGEPTADPAVTTPVSSRTTSAPSPSTTTAPPTTASSTKATQEAAAIALIGTYVDEYNKALQSGSTTAFRDTFKQTCAFCLGEATTIEATFRNKQRLQGLQYAVASLHVTLHDSRQIWVEGRLSQAGGKVLSASGAVVHNVTPTPPFRVLWRVKPGSPPLIVASENL